VCVQLLDFAVGIGQQHSISPGQSIQQFFNLLLHAGKLHVQRGQFGIDRFPLCRQRLELGQLLDHFAVQEPFKFPCTERPAAVTAFTVGPLGAAEILNACRIADAHKRVSAAATLDLSGKPCVLCLSPALERLVRHELLPAAQPCIRRYQPLAGSKNKYLIFQVLVFSFLHIPALIEIAAVCSGKICRFIDYHRPLTFEELVHIEVGLRVNGISQKLGDKAPCHFLAVDQDALVGKVTGDVPERGCGLRVHFKHQLCNICRFRVRLHHFCADALNGGRLQLEAVGGRAAHVKTVLAAGIVGIGHALLDGFTFKLGEHNADIQHGPPHRGGRVKLLRGRYELNIVFLKSFHHGCEVQNGTADTIQLVDHYALDQAPANIGHQLLELGPVGVLAGIALVGVLAEIASSQLILAELNLAFNADTVLAVNGLSAINGIFTNNHLVLLSV